MKDDLRPSTSREDADVHASSDEYAARFAGSVGSWMLDVQEQAIRSLLDPECTSVLDVGGGHGQIALPLSRAHRSVTVLGSSPICGDRLREQIDNGMISFKTGNLLEIPFSKESFDLVVSFRLLSHSTAWKSLIAELCRVAQHAVIIDYPLWVSANILNPLLFKVKRRVEGNTRTFRIFTMREVKREFKKHGFVLERGHRQFFFPMGLHRALNKSDLSKSLEQVAAGCGATRFFGSPIVAKFVRRKG